MRVLNHPFIRGLFVFIGGIFLLGGCVHHPQHSGYSLYHIQQPLYRYSPKPQAPFALYSRQEHYLKAPPSSRPHREQKRQPDKARQAELQGAAQAKPKPMLQAPQRQKYDKMRDKKPGESHRKEDKATSRPEQNRPKKTPFAETGKQPFKADLPRAQSAPRSPSNLPIQRHDRH